MPTRRPWIEVLLLALALAHVATLFFVCDDAFIAFRYAGNLEAGHGLVFNPGERVEGYTSFSWVLICSALLALGLRPETWAPWLSAAIALGAFAGLVHHQRRNGRDVLVFGTLLAANGSWAAWATGGLETALFTALVSFAFVSATAAPSPSRPPRSLLTSGLLLAAAALTRPEGLLVAVLFGAFLLFEVLRERLAARELAMWAALWIVPAAIHVLWRFGYYGDLLPNTFHVKVHGVDRIAQGIDYVTYAMRRLHLYLLLIPIGGAFLMRGSISLDRARVTLGTLVVVPYLGYVAFVGGDFMDMFRFVTPVLPIVFLVVSDLTSGVRLRHGWTGVVATVLVVYVALNAHTSLDTREPSYRHQLDSIGQLREHVDHWTRVGRFLARVSQPSDTLATTAAGCIPYYSGLHTIDQLGLVAPDLREYFDRGTSRPGHSLQIRGEALLSRRPHYVLGGAPLTPPDQLQRALYIEPGWEAEFERAYQTASVTPPELGGKRLTFAVRADVAARFRAEVE